MSLIKAHFRPQEEKETFLKHNRRTYILKKIYTWQNNLGMLARKNVLFVPSNLLNEISSNRKCKTFLFHEKKFQHCQAKNSAKKFINSIPLVQNPPCTTTIQ